MSTRQNECAYAGCKNKRKNKNNFVSFFKFPVSKPDILCQWVQNCGNAEIFLMDDNSLINKRLCENHFAKSDIYPSGERHLLKKNAVPIFWKGKCFILHLIFPMLLLT